MSIISGTKSWHIVSLLMLVSCLGTSTKLLGSISELSGSISELSGSISELSGSIRQLSLMVNKTKKVEICGKYVTRYNASLRKIVKKFEITQHAKYVSPFCGKSALASM